MDWQTLLTAGSLSAVISSAVSIVSTRLTLKGQQKKQRFDSYFQQVLEIRRRIHEIEEPDFSPMLARGHINGVDAVVLLQRFREFDEIYFPNEILFDKDLRKRADAIRLPVNRAVTDTAVAGKVRELRGEYPNPDWDDPMSIDVWEKVVKYPNLISEIVDEQLDRLKV